MIKLKSPEEIEAMKVAGSISKLALRRVGAMIRPGVDTLELDRVAESVIRASGAVPAFKGFRGFPASICCSINEEIVHGIPASERTFKSGDIVSIDTGAVAVGWVGDCAWTFFCGTPSEEHRALCEITRDCLKAGIKQAVPGNRLGDIGHAVQSLAERHGYGVVRDYTGHGVGHDMHEEPNVPNYGRRGRGVRLQEGMVIAIEPMVTLKGYEGHVLPNRWTVVTDDGGIAAHYENTVAITSDGPVILTADIDGPWCSLYGASDEVEA